MRHGDHDCAIDVLTPIFGIEAASIATSYTCFPLDCRIASEQARRIVERVLAGEDRWAVLQSVEETALAQMRGYDA
jgi:hypothetical protein